ncbi:MAG: transposase, partial [Planctomycetes bacterium]|nr:transposase [Planctomycetota bacterium]
LERWRHQDIGEDRRAGPHTAPINKLSAGEEQRVLSAVNQPEFCDLPPKQIVPILAERGVYVASEATVYRILRKAKQQRHRETTRVPRKRHQLKELVAVAPNQVWSWDITWLPSTVRGMYFRAYMVLDVWSRKIVAAEVFEYESGEHAADLVAQACERAGIVRNQLSLHADNGGPMKACDHAGHAACAGCCELFQSPRCQQRQSLL